MFLIAWRRREKLPAEPLPWLYGVARRVLSEQRRSATRRHALGARLRATADISSVDLSLSDRGLAVAVARLPERYREALLLRYWEDLSPEQLAQALGCSRAAVAVRLHRARKRLQDELRALDEAEACVVEVKPT